MSIRTYDLAILDYIQAHLTHPNFDSYMVFLSKIGNFTLIWLILGGILWLIPSTRNHSKQVFTSLVIYAVLSNVLKFIIQRPRPFEIVAVDLLIHPPIGHSFPSGHTASSWAVAITLWQLRSSLRYPAMLLAILISYSRLYLYVHYPTDILGGIFLGCIIAFITAKIFAAKESWTHQQVKS